MDIACKFHPSMKVRASFSQDMCYEVTLFTGIVHWNFNVLSHQICMFSRLISNELLVKMMVDLGVSLHQTMKTDLRELLFSYELCHLSIFKTSGFDLKAL